MIIRYEKSSAVKDFAGTPGCEAKNRKNPITCFTSPKTKAVLAKNRSRGPHAA
jgi:hypothetical protein